MAGVLEQFRWPFSRRAELYRPDFMPIDPRAQQLQEAKEILSEVHGIDIHEVEEMICQRMEERTWRYEEEKEPWPEMLWVEQ
jgi:hypothetical protein